MTTVTIDARSLADSSSFRGIGSYLRNLLAGLTSVPGLQLQALAADDAPLPSGVARVPVVRRLPSRFSSLEHDLLLPRELRKAGGDVFHSPALDPPRRCPMPWVQTLHDVIPLVDDSPGFDLERRRWRRYAPRFREASAVIAISRYCADQGIALLGLDPRVVHVVYHGVSERFRTGPPEPREDPYVLYVGEFDPRKGYKEAFAVAGELAEAGLPHRLKVAGRIAPWRRAEIEQLAAAAPRPDRIDLLGYVDHDNELPALYRGASAMLITSRHEGFGLPAAEAMAMGLPVVAFRNTATTEIVADGGILVDDGDVAGFAGRVRDLLTDDRRWAAASAAGIDRASVFEWQQCADEHAAIYAAIQS